MERSLRDLKADEQRMLETVKQCSDLGHAYKPTGAVPQRTAHRLVDMGLLSYWGRDTYRYREP